MEQRIASLEKEVKLLKNEIRNVLLDIKESLSGEDWQHAGKGDVYGAGQAVRNEEQAAREENAGREANSATVYQAEEEGNNRHSGHSGDNGSKSNHTNNHRGMEPLLLMLVQEWLNKTSEEIGVDATRKILEVYAGGEDLDEEMRRMLRLVSGIWGGSRENNIAHLKYLLELDALLTNTRQHEFQNVLLNLFSNERTYNKVNGK